MMTNKRFGLAAGLAFTLGVSMLAYIAPAAAAGGNNDFSCQPSAAHPDPVVLLHGGFANKNEDLNFLQASLATQGYCTFSLTYGTIDGFPYVGAIGPTAPSGVQIADFINQVQAATGAAKIDLVGHSTGAFMSLYVPKLDGVAGEIGKVVAIAPPTEGLSGYGFLSLAQDVIGPAELSQIEQAMGTNNFDNLAVGSAAVNALDNGPIAQPGITYTIIVSLYDEIVTPVQNSYITASNVTNESVQQFCPLDPVGHIGEAYDTNVWQMVTNALDPATAAPISICVFGAPF
jgi:triacylglycerol esterase/lipase EstA (alpha/beta hydrolase family)